MLNRNYFSFVVLLLILLHITALGQNGLQKSIGNLVDKKVETSKKVNETPILVNDTVKMVVQDTAIKQTEQEVLEQAVEFDTTEFKNRNVAVKARKPSVDYPNEDAWQKELLITHTAKYSKLHKLDSTRHVFGWHPYWMGNAYRSYNFSLLSVVAYFSYELNPSTGMYKTIHDWKTTSLVDSAHKHGCKVVLSVTNFGTKNNAEFLSNITAQKTFINTLITLIRERNADGVNLDFEAIPASSRNDLSNFIIDLSSSLRAARKDYLITIALPAVDFDNVYEMSQLTQHVDMFVIMGYEFYGSNSKVAGPVAPLTSGKTWWPYNLERAVDEYLVAGVPSNKLLLGLPYYGAEWQTKDLKFPSKVEKFIGYTMYRNIKNEHGDLPCCQDEISGSKFYVYRDQNNKYRQIWYEDKQSLSKKYDWIKNKGIGGIGIWALGYDNGHTELWELIADKFALKDSVVVAIQKAEVRKSRVSWQYMLSYVLRIINNPRSLITNPRPLMAMFGAIFGLSVAGIFILLRYGYRFKRIYKILLQGGVSLLVLILFALIFITMKYAGLREVAFLLGGFLVAGILFFIFSRRFLVERDLP